MTATFTITSARNAGEKPNPHGGTLVKWYLKLADSEAGNEDVYCQKKLGNDLSPGMAITGRLEKGEYGWRLFPETERGNFKAPSYQRDNGLSKDDYWRNKEERDIESQARMGRAHAQEMALRREANHIAAGKGGFSGAELLAAIDGYHDDVQRFPLDADVGGGTSGSTHVALSSRSQAAADVNAEGTAANLSAEEAAHIDSVNRTGAPPEASPAQKRRLTNEFKKVGLVPEVMKAVVMVRCRSEKATKDGASALIQDLVDGATAESLLAEVYDAKRAGDPVGIRAAKLIPENSPVDTSDLPELEELDGEVGVAKYDDGIPF